MSTIPGVRGVGISLLLERETDTGRIRKASGKAAESVERFDPEGGKSPGGEWRQRKQQSEPGEVNRNGLEKKFRISPKPTCTKGVTLAPLSRPETQ